MPYYNVCGGSASGGSNGTSANLTDGTVGVLVRHREGTTNEFMSSSNVTPLNYNEYYGKSEALKSLLVDNDHIAFRPATVADAIPYLQMMAHVGNGSIQSMRPTGKHDRLSLTLQNPNVVRLAPTGYVRTPMQTGAEALQNLRERLEDLGGRVGTVSTPDMHALGYQQSDRSNCIDPHDDHSSTDFDKRGMFGLHTCRYNFYGGMHSKVIISAVGKRTDEDGIERSKTFGHCSFPLDSDIGFYIFDPTGQYCVIALL